MARHPGRGGHAWRKARARVLAEAQVCCICGGALDFDADPRSPMAPSVDHEIPISLMAGADRETQRKMALDPANLRAVHMGCNARRGNRRAKPKRATSREW